MPERVLTAEEVAAKRARRRAYMKAYNQRPEVIARRGERNRARYAADPERFKAKHERHRQSRLRFLTAVRTTCGCIDCGTREGRLAFDHRPGTVKEFNPSSHGVSWARMLAEIDKCDVRCTPCHAARHEAEKRQCRS